MTWAAPRRPSRREVLVGGGLLAVAGCLGPPDSPPVDPFAAERRLRERVAREVSELSSAYDAVLARFPEAADELATLAAEHAAHIAALRGPQPSAPPSTASSPPSSPPASVPSTVAEARVVLAA
ncbi:MAG TPA: hypothetical protein VFV76_04905, partial [Actinomycetes bacterium]|nr:hypothetical protein [Actinomycetes bacterium]